MRIVILNQSGIPIYEQIKEQIKAAIYAGDILEGEMLPSIRQLARDLKISVITTTRAYNDLEKEGFIYNVQGKGCYVKPQDPELRREQALCEIEQHFQDAVLAAKRADISSKELTDMLGLAIKEELV